MSKRVSVDAEHEYEVQIGIDWKEELARSISTYPRVVFVISESMSGRLESLPDLMSECEVLVIPDGEAGKSSQTLENLWSTFGSFGLTRSDLVVAIGGGATTDIVGFAAATWLRGVDWVAIPTSLAGMVDASVGGKTGMNSTFGKNLIGAFHSPRKVIIDLGWLETLSDRDFSAGLAEVIKCGFISDSRILELIDGYTVDSLRRNRQVLEDLIFRAVSVKAAVVTEDFRETFAREVLNYGHTMGHAVEMDSEYALRHGEAVAIGMVFIAHLAHIRGLLGADKVLDHKDLLERFGLPTSYPRERFSALLPLLYRDKKARGRTLRFIVLNDQNQVLRLEGVSEKEIEQAYGKIAT